MRCKPFVVVWDSVNCLSMGRPRSHLVLWLQRLSHKNISAAKQRDSLWTESAQDPVYHSLERSTTFSISSQPGSLLWSCCHTGQESSLVAGRRPFTFASLLLAQPTGWLRCVAASAASFPARLRTSVKQGGSLVSCLSRRDLTRDIPHLSR